MRHATGIAAIITLLTACGGNASTPSLGGSSVSAQSVHNMRGLQQHPLAHSWMRKPPRGTTGTIWATDLEYASVDVIAYPSGTLIGQAAGFSYPFGDCSDKQGNVYVADISLEEGFEIQAGTTKVINSWATGGESIGCSVSNAGDVAFSNYSPSSVVIFPGGGSSGHTYSKPGSGPAGYDPYGNLFVMCSGVSGCSPPKLAELPAGGSSWIFLNVNGPALSFPQGAQWMDKYLGVATVGTSNLTGIVLLKISGSTASIIKTITLEGSGCSTYMGASISWGSVANKPNGVVTKKIKDIIASNLWCFPSPINVYKAKGGDPIDSIYALNYQYIQGVTFTKP